MKSSPGDSPPSDKHERNALERFSTFVDQHILAVRFGILSVGFCGIAIVTHRLRMFSKFSRKADIPDWFFDRHISLYGQIKGIQTVQTNGKQDTVISVSHTPILYVKLRTAIFGPANHRHLRIKLWGLNNQSPMQLTNYLTKWLSQNANNRQSISIRFTLMHNPKEFPEEDVINALCYVRKNWWMTRTCLNEAAIKNGIVRIDSKLQTLQFQPNAPELASEVDRFTKRWIEKLEKAERIATKRRVGLWHTPGQQLSVWAVTRKLASLMHRLLSRLRGS